MTKFLPDIVSIKQAYEKIKIRVHQTPVMSSSAINEIAGARILFKCENFQKVGAFKFRGATNAVFSLSNDEAKNGVATHSSGNHAAALALAAKMRGIPAYIVMPVSAPEIKKKAVQGYGAKITFCEPTLEARETTLNEVVKETGATFIHPYNRCDIISGQGTATLEFIESEKNFDIIMAPVGGGGLLSGTAIAAKSLIKNIKVYGAEPEKVNDAWKSFTTGVLQPPNPPDSIADGLLTALGEINFEVIKRNVDSIYTVSEERIVEAMRIIWERMKIIVEPSSAVPLACILSHPSDFAGKKIGIVISGGNVDLSALPFK